MFFFKRRVPPPPWSKQQMFGYICLLYIVTYVWNVCTNMSALFLFFHKVENDVNSVFISWTIFFNALFFSIWQGVKLVVCWISSLWKWVIWCSACCNWLKSHCFEIVKYQNCFIVKIYSHEKSKFWFAGQTDSQFCYQGNSLFIFKSPQTDKVMIYQSI